MSSVATTPDPVYSDESGMNDLVAELKLEMCSYLEVHDQYAMRKVSKWWRSNITQAFLSQYVDLDVSKIPEQPGNPEKNLDPQGQEQSEKQDKDPEMVSEDPLEHALKIHVQKNTKILILRNVDFNGKKFGTLAKVIKEKESRLIRLIFKDCELLEEYKLINYWWLHPQRIALKMLYGLMPATKHLILDNFLIRNILSGAVMSEYDIVFGDMQSHQPIQKRLAAGHMYKKLPIRLPRLEVDCRPSATGPDHWIEAFRGVYRAFITAVDAQCPPVTPEVLEELGRLCSYWPTSRADQNQWQTLRAFFSCLNEGVLLTVRNPTVNIEDLRHLDPLTFNRLTSAVLHRMYCLPSDGTVYTPAADSGFDATVTYME